MWLNYFLCYPVCHVSIMYYNITEVPGISMNTMCVQYY
jgi:hypothetical protein